MLEREKYLFNKCLGMGDNRPILGPLGPYLDIQRLCRVVCCAATDDTKSHEGGCERETFFGAGVDTKHEKTHLFSFPALFVTKMRRYLVR